MTDGDAMSSFMKKTLLLVEDEAIIALAQKMALERYGYGVQVVSSGEEAIGVVNSSTAIDMVLMDINLGGGIDGTHAAQIMLRNHDIPIVFVSSHSEPEIVEKAGRIASYGYVVMPSASWLPNSMRRQSRPISRNIQPLP